MLAFSIGTAQNAELDQVIEGYKTISVSNIDVLAPSIDAKINNVKEDDTVLINASELKSTISRTNSDIRIYLYRKRNAGNISFVFPKINKAVRV